MPTFYVISACVLAAILGLSGVGKLAKNDQVVESLTKAQVPMSWYRPLATLEFAGVAGLLLGILYRPVGIAAGIGLMLYFVGAIIAHVRAKDIQGVTGPGGLLVASAAPVVFGVATM